MSSSCTSLLLFLCSDSKIYYCVPHMHFWYEVSGCLQEGNLICCSFVMSLKTSLTVLQLINPLYHCPPTLSFVTLYLMSAVQILSSHVSINPFVHMSVIWCWWYLPWLHAQVRASRHFTFYLKAMRNSCFTHLCLSIPTFTLIQRWNIFRRSRAFM